MTAPPKPELTDLAEKIVSNPNGYNEASVAVATAYLEQSAEIARLREALQGLVDGVTPEVNEKGAGGFLLARLSDAKAALKPAAQSEGT